MIIPGASVERARGERALHCYYNKTRINTSRLYTWSVKLPSYDDFRGGGVAGAAQRGGSQQPPQFARPSEKLSEIMSEEIGSLARGWLTAGLPASSPLLLRCLPPRSPSLLPPFWSYQPFTGLRRRPFRLSLGTDHSLRLRTLSCFTFFFLSFSFLSLLFFLLTLLRSKFQTCTYLFFCPLARSKSTR